MTTALTNVLALCILISPLQFAFGDDPEFNAHSEKQSTSIVGCMTTACHGSNASDAKNWQRAGKIWFDQDPHARAYTSLLNDASAKIVSRLVNKDLKPSSPAYRNFLNAKCVSCHSNENVSETQRVLGADCQVCHGSADAWGSQHYSSKWRALGNERFHGTLMFNVESIVGRAQVCASCHVGELNRKSASGSNENDREVDHRMIAAGHPPMYFDFESYLRRYPVHWETQDEPIRLGSKIGIERWRIGKITTTIAKLKLLSARAARVTNENCKVNDWPELAEYSCTSCHHSIELPRWRQVRGSNSMAIWDGWTISQLDCAVREQSINDLKSQLIILKINVEKSAPEPRQVAVSATTLQRWLEGELEHVSSPAENSDEVLLPKLRSRLANVNNLPNWESATQWYIATRVLSEAIGLVGLQAPVSFVADDPFLGVDKTWNPTSSKEIDTPRIFHPHMLKNYSNALIQQLRKRP